MLRSRALTRRRRVSQTSRRMRGCEERVVWFRCSRGFDARLQERANKSERGAGFENAGHEGTRFGSWVSLEVKAPTPAVHTEGCCAADGRSDSASSRRLVMGTIIAEKAMEHQRMHLVAEKEDVTCLWHDTGHGTLRTDQEEIVTALCRRLRRWLCGNSQDETVRCSLLR